MMKILNQSIIRVYRISRFRSNKQSKIKDLHQRKEKAYRRWEMSLIRYNLNMPVRLLMMLLRKWSKAITKIKKIKMMIYHQLSPNLLIVLSLMDQKIKNQLLLNQVHKTYRKINKILKESKLKKKQKINKNQKN